MLDMKLLIVDVGFGEAVETTVVIHEAACALMGYEGAIGQGELDRGSGDGGCRLGWLVELDTCQSRSVGRKERTDETEVVELVECGKGTETLCGLFVCVVAYGGDLRDGVEEEGTAVGEVSGRSGEGERTDRTICRLAAVSKRSTN